MQFKKRILNKEYLYSIYGSNLKNFILVNDYDEIDADISESYDHKLYYIIKWFYKKQKCIDLIINYENENNFKYDFVLLTRSDILFLKNIDFNIFENNKFYIEPHGKKIFDKNKIPKDFSLDKFGSTERLSLFGYGHPNWYISNSSDLYKFINRFIELHKYNISHPPKSHFFTLILISLYLENIDIILNNTITPITIIHCYENIDSDRSHKNLGFPDEYNSCNDFLKQLKYSIQNDTIL